MTKDNLRWGKSVESDKKRYEPEDGINRLHGKLGRREQQREKGNIASHRQRPEGTEETTISQCYQAERDDDNQDGFFVDMPAE